LGIKYAPNLGSSTFTTTSGISYSLAQINNVSSTPLSASSAQINFGIIPSNTTSVWLQYGTNPAFTSGLLTQTLSSIPAGNVEVPVSTTLTGLTAGTKYYYRVRTSNSVGDNYSPNTNYFFTFGIPILTNVTSSVISNTAAKIAFALDTNGATTSIAIEYSTDLSFSNSKSLGSSATPNAISGFLSGLTPGETYNYRIKATNSVSSVTSTTQNFILSNTTVTPAVVAEFKFNNSYSSEVGSINFISNSKTSFTTDRYLTANGALNLADTSSIATIPNLPSGGWNRSVSIWVKLNTLKNTNPLFLMGSTPDQNQLYFSSTNIFVERDLTTLFDVLGTTDAGVWYHYVQTFDGTTVKLYRNGSLLGEAIGDFFTTLNSQTFMLGKNTEVSAKIDGAVDDLSIYNYVLTPTQVNNLYLIATLNTSTSSLKGAEIAYQIYPNPAFDRIKFNHAVADFEKHIIDMQGNVVAITNENELSVSHLPNGIYLLKYFNAANQIGYTMFMKK